MLHNLIYCLSIVCHSFIHLFGCSFVHSFFGRSVDLTDCICFLFAVNSLGCRYKDDASLELQCQEQQHIYLGNITLGRSAPSCQNNMTCCPSTTVCTKPASAQLVRQFKTSCDGKQQCKITVVKRWCPYRYPSYWGNTDYQSVDYFCINSPSKLVLHYLN